MHSVNSAGLSRQVRVLVRLKNARGPRFESWIAPFNFFGFGGEEGGKILPYCSRGNRRLRMACARTDARSGGRLSSGGDGRVHQLLYTSFRSSTQVVERGPCIYPERRS